MLCRLAGALPVLLMIPAIALPAAAACTTADIQIASWNWERDRGWTTVTGTLVNNCAEPTGVQLQLTFRDEAGRAVTIDNSWVADRRNIPAGATHAFRFQLRANATSKSAAIDVSEVRRWGSRP